MSTASSFRRIVVSVSGETSAGAIAAAADLARFFDAELAGLFIEDETILGLADLPFAAEVAIAGAARPLRRDDVERSFRSASSIARRRLEAAARTAQIAFTFARERGSVRAVVEHTAGPGDIVMFFEPERAIERACSVTLSLLAAAFGSQGSLLYVPERALAWRGVTAVVDGRADTSVLGAAVRIAAARRVPLSVVTSRGHRAWRPILEAILAERGRDAPAIDAQTVEAESTAAVLEHYVVADDRFLVLARAAARVASAEALRKLARRRRAPVLLVEPVDRSA